MGRTRIAALVVVLASLPALAVGCQVERGAGNGLERVLHFSEITAGDFGAVPVGVTRKVTVGHSTGGVEVCEPSLGHGGGDCSGGASPDPITLVSASCEPVQCDFDLSGADGNKAVLRFTAKTPGSTRVRVTVKSKSDGETYSDSFNVRFAEAKRLAVLGNSGSLLPYMMPVFVGLELGRPTAEIHDAEGLRLTLDDGDPPFALQGSSVREESFPLKSVAAGITKVTWDAAGLKRSIDIEVIDAAEVKSLVAWAATPESGAAKRRGLEEAIELQKTAPPDRLEMPASQRGVIVGVVFVHGVLADGRNALVPITKSELVPPLPNAEARPSGQLGITIFAPGTPGDATLHIEGPSVSRDIPIQFR